MCGIAGIVGLHPVPGREELVGRMLEALGHRGPDDRGIWSARGEEAALGSCRLSILDLSAAGHQPMVTSDYAISYNGEIYNFAELRRELEADGVEFCSQSDTEVVLRAWERWGEKSLERFNGMFAFFILDRRRRRGHLVRDRLGIKPCFYSLAEGRLIFASEAKAFYRLPPRFWQPQTDEKALESLLSFQFLPNPEKTPFRNLSRLPPGHLLEYDLEKGEGCCRRHYRLESSPHIPTDRKRAVKEARDILTDSVKLRLRADVPVGILLSGGLDSSLIAALAAQEHPEPIQTFTAGFRHRLDERPQARLVARAIGSEHHEVELDPAEMNRRIEEVIPVFDALTSLDAGIFTIYFILEKLKKYRAKVLLVGEGADETFGGYSWFRLSRPPLSLLPLRVRTSLHHYAISRMLRQGAPGRRLLHEQVVRGGEGDIFRQVSRWEIETQLPSHYLMKVDHATMAHSTEARVPYLDHRLVEFAFGLPGCWKFAGSAFTPGGEKAFLRQLAAGLLPAETAARPKLGFPLSMGDVLKSNRDKVLDSLLAETGFARSRFSRSRIERMAEFKPRMYSPWEKEKEFLLWKLFLIETWQHWVRETRKNAERDDD